MIDSLASTTPQTLGGLLTALQEAEHRNDRKDLSRATRALLSRLADGDEHAVRYLLDPEKRRVRSVYNLLCRHQMWQEQLDLLHLICDSPAALLSRDYILAEQYACLHAIGKESADPQYPRNGLPSSQSAKRRLLVLGAISDIGQVSEPQRIEFLIDKLEEGEPYEVEYFLSGSSERIKYMYRLLEREGLWGLCIRVLRIALTNGVALFSPPSLVEKQLACFKHLGITGQNPTLPEQAAGSQDAPTATMFMPRTENTSPRHIAVVGMAYCGSTILDLVLGGLADTKNAGESHWLVDARSQDPGDDARVLTASGLETCAQCGSSCRVITDDLRDALSRATDYYGTLGRWLGADVLVSADKSYWILLRLDRSLAHDSIVSFRHPARMWGSYSRHTGKDDAGAERRYFELWSTSYRGFVHNYAPRGRKVYLDFDRFAAQPRDSLRYLTASMRLQYDERALEYWNGDKHFIAGNSGVRGRLAEGATERLGITPGYRYYDDPYAAAPEAAEAYSDALQVWRDLVSRAKSLADAEARSTWDR